MRATRAIIVATMVTSLWILPLPAHAGEVNGFGDGVETVTAAECMTGEGIPMNGVCQGGTEDGSSVSG